MGASTIAEAYCVQLLAKGCRPDIVARRLGLPLSQVEAIMHAHGASLGDLADWADEYTRRLNNQPQTKAVVPGQLNVATARRWTPAEDAIILTMKPTEAADILKRRTLDAIHARRIKLRKQGSKTPNYSAPWTAEADQLVMLLPAKEAAEQLGRTVGAVAKRRKRLKEAAARAARAD